MANTLDPEAAKGPNATSANTSAGRSFATDSEDIDFFFESDRKQCIDDLETSKQDAEKRLGILLLLKYKYTLDRLGEEYFDALYTDSIKCPVTCEPYSACP